MNLKKNWQDNAVCASDEKFSAWLSHDKKSVDYAKFKCRTCPVIKECLVSAWLADSIIAEQTDECDECDEDLYADSGWVGVRGGLSEYDYLVSIWREVEDERESNWHRDDSILRQLLQRSW